MGERRKDALRVDFDRGLKLEFHGATVTSDAGLFTHRELDETFTLTDMADDLIEDRRTGKNTQHGLVGLFRQSIYSRIAGYEDTNDAERLRRDPTIRHVVGVKRKDRNAASTSQMGRFETEILTQESNLQALKNLSGLWIDQVRADKPFDKLILDLDSSVSPTHGRQEGSSYNGHFGCNCYHPLFCFNQQGDVEGCMLREGRVHSADQWRSLLEPIVDRYRDDEIPKFFRGDAAFANPDIYEFLENEEFFYAIRLPANDVLYDVISALLVRPVGRPPRELIVMYQSIDYQSGSWDKPRRVVAKVEWHREELFPRTRFIVTNLSWSAKKVVRYYNQRGTAEQWIKEGKIAVKWTRLSCCDFQDNKVRLQLFVLAYNLANFLRRLALPKSMKHWTLTTLREKLIKIGAKVIARSRYVTFQMAEVAVPRELFAAILQRIRRLRLTQPAAG